MGRPAPEITASAPAATAAFTASAYWRVATMAFTATRPAPFASRFAFSISFFSARRFAPWGFEPKSGSL